MGHLLHSGSPHALEAAWGRLAARIQLEDERGGEAPLSSMVAAIGRTAARGSAAQREMVELGRRANVGPCTTTMNSMLAQLIAEARGRDALSACIEAMRADGVEPDEETGRLLQLPRKAAARLRSDELRRLLVPPTAADDGGLRYDASRLADGAPGPSDGHACASVAARAEAWSLFFRLLSRREAPPHALSLMLRHACDGAGSARQRWLMTRAERAGVTPDVYAYTTAISMLQVCDLPRSPPALPLRMLSDHACATALSMLQLEGNTGAPLTALLARMREAGVEHDATARRILRRTPSELSRLRTLHLKQLVLDGSTRARRKALRLFAAQLEAGAADAHQLGVMLSPNLDPDFNPSP